MNVAQVESITGGVFPAVDANGLIVDDDDDVHKLKLFHIKRIVISHENSKAHFSDEQYTYILIVILICPRILKWLYKTYRRSFMVPITTGIYTYIKLLAL